MCRLYLGHLLLPEQVCVTNTAFFFFSSYSVLLTSKAATHMMLTDFSISRSTDVHSRFRRCMCAVATHEENNYERVRFN